MSESGELSLVEALSLIATLSFRPFSDSDYCGWSGVESENPLIAENDEFVCVIDGEIVEFVSMNGHICQQFSLREM